DLLEQRALSRNPTEPSPVWLAELGVHACGAVVCIECHIARETIDAVARLVVERGPNADGPFEAVDVTTELEPALTLRDENPSPAPAWYRLHAFARSGADWASAPVAFAPQAPRPAPTAPSRPAGPGAAA